MHIIGGFYYVEQIMEALQFLWQGNLVEVCYAKIIMTAMMTMIAAELLIVRHINFGNVSKLKILTVNQL